MLGNVPSLREWSTLLVKNQECAETTSLAALPFMDAQLETLIFPS